MLSVSRCLIELIFQNITLLSRFSESCDDIGECHNDDKLNDFRAINNVPYQCALYSFCPDQCCPLRQAAHPTECQEVNPCRNSMVKDRVSSLYLICIFDIKDYSCECDKFIM